jgi:hypothetical protein
VFVSAAWNWNGPDRIQWGGQAKHMANQISRLAGLQPDYPKNSIFNLLT